MEYSVSSRDDKTIHISEGEMRPTVSYDATTLVNRTGAHVAVPDGKKIGLVPLSDLTDEELIAYHLGVFEPDDVQ